MSDKPKCVAGCMIFDGGERKHHRDCPYYPESLTKARDDAEAELRAEIARLREVLKRIAKPEAFWAATASIDAEAYARMIYAEFALRGDDLATAERAAEDATRAWYAPAARETAGQGRAG